MFKQKVWPIAIGLIGLITLSSAACAEETVTTKHQFTVSTSTHITIDNSVGEIEFLRTDSNQLEIELTIKATEDGFFYGGGDIHAVKLVSDWADDTLSLRIEPDEDVNAEWRVKLPKVAEVEVDMGVGKIHGELLTTDSNFDLGVGDVDLTLYGDDISRISVDAGIGDTEIRGFAAGEVKTTRAMVSSESDARGSGNYRISADVGVGEASFTIRGLK